MMGAEKQLFKVLCRNCQLTLLFIYLLVLKSYTRYKQLYHTVIIYFALKNTN